ncbi:MAG TPA: 30S ribosomal protein S9 [Vampirovibrionales bacterium]
MSKQLEEYRATGRRKRAVARVILRKGKGDSFKVNGRELNEYFCESQTWLGRIKEPFTRTGIEEKFDVLVNVSGGGINGQADAIKLGIARALVTLDEGNKAVLKSFGLLTRDPREVERKKYYRRKARKMPQYSKR